MTIEALTQEIQAHYARLKQAADEAQFWYQRYVDEVKTHYQERIREIEHAFDQAHGRLLVDKQQALDAATAEVEQVVQETQAQLGKLYTTFRWVLAPWDDPAWEHYIPDPEAPIPSGLRIGRLAVPKQIDFPDLPALALLIGKGHVFLMGDDAEAARQMLQLLLLRLIVSFPPGTLRLNLTDPVGLGTNLSAFLRLPDTLRGDKVCSRTEEIERQLETLASQIEMVIQTRLLNLYPTVEAYNAQAGEIAVPYTIMALTDFPAGFTERMVDRLLNIARNGPRAGVYLLVSCNPSYALPRTLDLATLTTLGTTLHVSSKEQVTWEDPQLGRHPVIPDTLPPAERVNQYLEAIGQAIKQTATNLPFRRVAIPVAKQWQEQARDGLSVPIGINSTGDIHTMEIGQEQGIVHHGLIGGIVGSGKSNLLHVLITQLALKYSPEEVALYLVDFKEGVEFQHYLSLPHARAVALESEREFGLSILRHLQAEMEERGRLFKNVGANSLTAYRRQANQPLPRIVLIMDEFQHLFEEDDTLAREAGRILEDLVRRGRAFGIHVLLCSQSPTISGVYSNRIYNQMALRVALRCRAQDAQAILGEGNDAAKDLTQNGEAIYNYEMGHKEKNVFIRIALLEDQERQRYLEMLRAQTGQNQYLPPLTFEKRAPALLEENAEFQRLLEQPGWIAQKPSAKVWLGQPIEIQPITTAILERYARSSLLIVGGDEAQAYGLMLASLLSLAAQQSPEAASFLIADFARPESSYAGLFTPLIGRLPHPLEVAGPRQVGIILTQLMTTLTQRQNDEAAAKSAIYFLIPGMQRWRELRGSDPYVQSEAGKQLTHLSEEGPEVGIHLIAWADSSVTLERALKRGGIGAFDLRVALRLPEKESNEVIGSNAAARLEDNRAFFRHEDWEMGRLEKFKPYVVPETEVLIRLVEKIRVKAAQGREDGKTG